MEQTPPITPDDDATLAGEPVVTATGVASEGPGSTIGPYKLLQLIGEGGFGSVFMAEQIAPVRRKVALKIIKLGMDTRQVIARFEAERQALALMDHPNIARVLDAGATESGRPYFVMELVRGVPITEYCDTHRLGTADRLELFIRVCRAVQHAHQKGIIHRDIKPSNILVTLHDGIPVPKIIDFGIAKATQTPLTDKTLFTELRQFMGTPQYMPPEQAELSGLDVDTRSDIYSLGVLLYELLTGTTPFQDRIQRAAGVVEVQRIIRDEEPDKPSTRLNTLGATLPTVAAQRGTDPRRLSQAVRGELDWVVMKCLEKDRTRRYDTASALAADVQRYLADEPVQARPQSTQYRLRKFIARHRVGAAAGVALALALLLGIAGTTYGLLHARESRDDALEAKEESSRLAKEAILARQEAIDRLWTSYLAQARAGRWSGQIGRRFGSLDVIADAARIRFSPELRDEAVACMALVDLRPRRTLAAVDGTIAFDADFARYARSDAQGNITIRSAADDAPLMVLSGPGEGIGYLCQFSRDGRYLAVKHQAQQHRLVVWDLRSERHVLSLESDMRAEGVDFAPDGSAIAVARPDGSISVFELPGARERNLTTGLGQARLVRYSPDGTTLAFTLDPAIYLLDLPSGRITHRIQSPGGMNDLAWHPDGKLLASANDDFRAYLWRPGTAGAVAVMRGHLAEAIRVGFNPGGDLLATTGWDGTVRIWDPHSERQVLVAPSPDSFGVQFSSDGRQLACGAREQCALYDVAQRREYRPIAAHTAYKSPRGIDISRDGRRIVSAGTDGVRLWDIHSGRQIAHVPSGMTLSAFFHPADDSLLVSGPGGAFRWPIRTTSDGTLQIGPQQALTAARTRCVVSADGRLFAADIGQAHVALLDPIDPRERRFIGPHDQVSHLSISPDGRWLATGTRHGNGARVWDAATGQLMIDLPGVTGFAEVAFSPDGRWLVTGTRDEYRFWRVPSWQLSHRVQRDISSLPGFIGFSPDARITAIAVSNFLVRLVATDTGQLLLTLDAPDAYYVSWICFSPEGRRLAIATENQMIQIWDLSLLRQQLAGMGLAEGLPALPPPQTQTPAGAPPVRVVSIGAWPRHVIEDAVSAVTSRLQTQPDNAVALVDRGVFRLRLGRFDEAAADLSRAAELGSPDHWTWYRLAALRLYQGDLEEYRAASAQLLQRFGQASARDVAERVGKTLLLSPPGSEQMAAASDLIARAIAPGPAQGAEQWFRLAKGIAEYRAGRYPAAIDWLLRSRGDQLPPTANATAELFLAMSHHQSNDRQAARQALVRAEDVIAHDLARPDTGDLGQGGVENWLICHIALREARALLSIER